MATEFCQRCKQSHPGRTCDYDDKGECAETTDTNASSGPQETQPSNHTEEDRTTK